MNYVGTIHDSVKKKKSSSMFCLFFLSFGSFSIFHAHKIANTRWQFMVVKSMKKKSNIKIKELNI